MALFVVLDTLAPAERVTFVLHDLFAVPFDEIAEVLGRESAATRQLASRARRRVADQAPPPDPDLAPQRAVVTAFQTAARGGDLTMLVALLDPDVVVRIDRGALPSLPRRGPAEVARARSRSPRWPGPSGRCWSTGSPARWLTPMAGRARWPRRTSPVRA